MNIEKFKENITLYESLKAEHNCSINHVDSAGQMEVIGAEHILKIDRDEEVTLYRVLW